MSFFRRLMAQSATQIPEVVHSPTDIPAKVVHSPTGSPLRVGLRTTSEPKTKPPRTKKVSDHADERPQPGDVIAVHDPRRPESDPTDIPAPEGHVFVLVSYDGPEYGRERYVVYRLEPDNDPVGTIRVAHPTGIRRLSSP